MANGHPGHGAHPGASMFQVDEDDDNWEEKMMAEQVLHEIADLGASEKFSDGLRNFQRV